MSVPYFRCCFLALVVALGACSETDEANPQLEEMAQERGFNSFEEMANHDIAIELDERGIEHNLERGGESYQEYDDRRDSYAGSRGAFSGYGCTVDCSGHEAGYAWAEENYIEDPDDCGGNSWSFEEGCRAYAAEGFGY